MLLCSSDLKAKGRFFREEEGEEEGDVLWGERGGRKRAICEREGREMCKGDVRGGGGEVGKGRHASRGRKRATFGGKEEGEERVG
jgi:hypothetical protein